MFVFSILFSENFGKNRNDRRSILVMTCFKPFQALRPHAQFAQQALCPPYDVVTREEAEKIAADNPISFMHVIRAESDLPEEPLYSDAVYLRSAENLKKLEEDGIYFTDSAPLYYIYRQIMEGRSQTGIVGCSSVDDYEKGIIKKHEITRTDKEIDRIRHFESCSANTEPVFYFFRDNSEISEIIKNVTEASAPEYDVTDDAGVTHRLWPVYDTNLCRRLEVLFEQLPELYIADGHHRTASAAKVAKKRREAAPDYDLTEEFNRFMAVAFPADQLKVYDYNRLVKDLNGRTAEEFLSSLSEICTVESCTECEPCPHKKHTCSMYLEGKWYALSFEDRMPAEIGDGKDQLLPVKSLDVSFLQENVLSPLLGITDPKTDSRIGFVGGIKGLGELERRVDSGEMAVAFAMYPVSVEEIMNIADAGLVMPPKSTWFEPKLGSGLFVHKI